MGSAAPRKPASAGNRPRPAPAPATAPRTRPLHILQFLDALQADPPRSPETFQSLVGGLESRLLRRFASEEALLARSTLPEAEKARQRIAHATLLQHLQRLHRSSGLEARDRERLERFRRKLLDHILEGDQRVLQHLTRDSPAPPASSPAAPDASLVARCAQLEETRNHLRLAEERHAQALRAAGMANWALELDTLELEVSAEFLQLLAQPDDQPIHSIASLLQRVPEADHAQILDAIEHARAGDTGFSIEHRVSLPDGSERWLAVFGEPCHAPLQQGRWMTGLMRDITRERDYRVRLRDTNRQLLHSLSALEHHARDLTRLNELNEVLQGNLGSLEAFHAIQPALERLDLGCGGALAIAGESGMLRRVAVWGDGRRLNESFAAENCRGMRRNKPHVQRSADKATGCRHVCDNTGHYLCLPLTMPGEHLGLLTVMATPDTDEAQWMRLRNLSKMVAESLRLALSNVRLRAALQEQAMRDPLTGLLNRRCLDEALPRELARATRESRPLCVVMLDFDHFKEINDHWGHEAGDMVLAQTANILRAHLRSSDLACRFGGEEFVVLMPGASLAEARERMSGILAAVGSYRFEIGQRTLPKITFSAGMAEAPGHGKSAEALMRNADRALYAAKEAGRNRVCDAVPDLAG